MKIVCNGVMKSGTHLLLKAVTLFGVGEDEVRVRHAHDPWGSLISEEKHLQSVRNPRNILISWCRYVYHDDSEARLIDNIPRTIKAINEFAGWLNDDSVLFVRFENLLTDPEEINRLGKFIDLPPVHNHFEQLWGDTATFTGNHSNWSKVWTESLEQAWNDADGHVCETTWGYSN